MRGIYRYHAMAFIAPVINFALMGSRTVAEEGYYLFPVVVLFLPAWITASIAWSEKGESEPLVRSLPVTDRDVAKAKFTLALLAMTAYGLLITATAALVSPGAPCFAANMLYASVVWGGTLVLAALWYTGIWSAGYHRFSPALVTFIVLDVAAVLAFLVVARANRGTYIDAFGRLWRVPGGALAAVPVVLAAALFAYYALLGVAARARARSAF